MKVYCFIYYFLLKCMSFPFDLDYSNFLFKKICSLFWVLLPTSTDRILSFVSLIKFVPRNRSTKNKCWKLGVCWLVLILVFSSPWDKSLLLIFKFLILEILNLKNPLCWYILQVRLLDKFSSPILLTELLPILHFTFVLCFLGFSFWIVLKKHTLTWRIFLMAELNAAGYTIDYKLTAYRICSGFIFFPFQRTFENSRLSCPLIRVVGFTQKLGTGFQNPCQEVSTLWWDHWFSQVGIQEICESACIYTVQHLIAKSDFQGSWNAESV